MSKNNATFCKKKKKCKKTKTPGQLRCSCREFLNLYVKKLCCNDAVMHCMNDTCDHGDVCTEKFHNVIRIKR